MKRTAEKLSVGEAVKPREIDPRGSVWYVHYAHGRAYCSLLTNEFSIEGLRAWGVVLVVTYYFNFLKLIFFISFQVL